MAKTYITFGQIHTHSVNGKTFDKDCVAVIECRDESHGRDRAFELFGDKWCFQYHEDQWDEEDLKYFPRGLMDVDAQG